MQKTGLNEALMNLCHHMMEIEGDEHSSKQFENLTTNDFRIIDAVGITEPKSMSMIANKLSVTIGTLTKNINGLVTKGYVERKRSDEDRRVVYVTLTDSGKKAYNQYRDIQRGKIKTALSALDEAERKQLFRSVMKLNRMLAGK